ncbi:dCTP deaminase [Ignicoccus hospitalis]|uniref:dCTP deaminase n=1 Tax=Ignicoccus hospitalis (strain KIN4/I / DSM 18386 / JCM 14125) TaxID=453591 RepID=DCD_IGNH4|nr:dCTP deaminase [Ignicoccus hospitalis]A8A906.1 RecName: Full=dCTP deaminase; AltName: Full=Deoxycytidine triphosphate deaminase [Ignicoccus hospitalis KIN4/I]ABU81408.1 dCTP deaminase [Ignicoccus hospitalis KIN4/I]HIH90285.1 dCTP deaminase [Desulfurococcaceae archaeon]
MILSDGGIKSYLRRGLMKIEPFDENQVRENGVDLTIGHQYARFKNTEDVLDVTKEEDLSKYYELGFMDDEGIVIKPYEHVLLHTREYIEMPADLVGLVNLKSSFARLGLYIPPTVVDAGFKGEIVIEIIGSSFPVRVRPGVPFIHLVFLRTDSPVLRDYSVRGHYQGQRGIRLPKLPIKL